MMRPTTTPTAADLRAEIARYRIPLYLLGAAARVHPLKLGQMLRERRPLKPELAERVLEAIKELAEELTDTGDGRSRG